MKMVMSAKPRQKSTALGSLRPPHADDAINPERGAWANAYAGSRECAQQDIDRKIEKAAHNVFCNFGATFGKVKGR